MRFNRTSQLLLVSAISLAGAGLLTACGTLTVDFVYVTSAKAAGANSYGEIDVYEVNSESGHMRQIPTSPFPSGGRNPVSEATSADSTTLYVANEDDNSIVQFTIGNDGKVYPQNTVNTPGVFPVKIAATGGFLFVADTYQPLPSCSTAAPCSGSVAVFPILTAAQAAALTPAEPPDTLGSPVANDAIGANYWPLALAAKPQDVITPTSITTAGSGAYVYVAAVDTTTPGGYLFGFAVNSDGTLSALPGSPFAAGTHPSSLAPDPGGSYLYVTDMGANQVLTFSINSGALTEVGSAASGSQPAAVVIDAQGKYAYVANSQDSNLSAYSVSNGALSQLGTYTTGLDPIAIGIDPSLNQYIYTANFLGNSVTGFQSNANDGSLLNSQNSPYGANANPTAIAAIPHGTKTK
ncbi:MAG TPA: beta-propeller fold lactonase family protein [Terracidiphilus sp.]|nr:beta-propeller fold lactonase family protein [Terracidiphilus sp.]